MSRHVLRISNGNLHLDNEPFLVKGLRCSNALVSDAATHELIAHLDQFTHLGVNTVSVYWMGSRFGDVVGYERDGSLASVYADRMGRILAATDERGMAVLVGCLYWGDTRAKWDHWTQVEADAAVAHTIRWLGDGGHRNVLVDVDNEGMAQRLAGFDDRKMVIAAKSVDDGLLVGTNYRGDPPPEADLALHFSNVVPGKPYVESEGSPSDVAGGYWGKYSKREGLYQYLNVGVYSEEMKESQKRATRAHLDNGKGYMLASTWLQAPPPQGPNHRPGGYGSADDPGILWWLDFLREEYGPS